MPKRTGVRIPEQLRAEVANLVEHGVVATLNEAVRLGLTMLIHQYKLERWDDALFADYQAQAISKSAEGILLSRQFIKDVNHLTAEIPGIRKQLGLLFRRLVANKVELTKLEFTGLFQLTFTVADKFLIMIIRKQGEQLLACRVGYTTQLL